MNDGCSLSTRSGSLDIEPGYQVVGDDPGDKRDFLSQSDPLAKIAVPVASIASSKRSDLIDASPSERNGGIRELIPMHIYICGAICPSGYFGFPLNVRPSHHFLRYGSPCPRQYKPADALREFLTIRASRQGNHSSDASSRATNSPEKVRTAVFLTLDCP
jgi:hypothetical protein